MIESLLKELLLQSLLGGNFAEGRDFSCHALKEHCPC